MDKPLFSRDELHKLTVYRRWLFIGFPVIIVLLLGLTGIVCRYIFHIEDGAVAGLLGFVAILFTPCAFCYCLSKYNEAVRKTAYHLIVRYFHWSLFHTGPKEEFSFEDTCKALGLLPNDGYIMWHNFLQGERNGLNFSLSDISWMVVQGRTHSHSTKAQYTLLTVPQKNPIACTILLRRNKLFKWGIKDLKRLQLQDKTFEKTYDTYTDQPEEATALLNPSFTQSLLHYVQTSKKQVELILTPQHVFVFHNTGIWKKLFSLVIFRSPRVQCDKILKEITDTLDILPTISLLKMS